MEENTVKRKNGLIFNIISYQYFNIKDMDNEK
jgi:hypothetical protein